MRYRACLVFVLMARFTVVLNTSLTPFQGFLYVFGGMLDSAYSNSRYPLWVFDIGELLCGDQPLAANDKTCCCMSACEKYSAQQFTKLP